jgi:hypothetical protein
LRSAFEVEMAFLKTAVSVALFGIGLGVSGNWEKTVLDS